MESNPEESKPNNNAPKKRVASYVGIGLALGLVFGAAFGNVALGLVLGIAIGAVAGAKRPKNKG